MPRTLFSSVLSTGAVLATLTALATPASAQEYLGDTPGDVAFDNFGTTMAGGADFDGDGGDDIAIGSPYIDYAGLVDNGRIRILSGKTGRELRSYHSLTAGHGLGKSVALLGDVNGDGRCDFAVGAISGGAGALSVVNGSNSAALWSISGNNGDRLGEAIAAAGDVDRDGDADLIVGAPGKSAVYVYGGRTGNLLWSFTGPVGDEFGRSVSGNVDVDGDGVKDIVVGSPNYDVFLPVPKTDAGRVVVYSGKTGALLVAAAGDVAHMQLGEVVLGLGDVDGDHQAEFLAAAPHYDSATLTDCGLVRCYQSTGAKRFDLVGARASIYFGESLAAVPSVDSDQRPDFLVGSTHSTGTVELHSGSSGSGALLWTYFSPDPAGAFFGSALASGDFDGDGFGDVAVGDPFASPSGKTWAGAGYRFLSSIPAWDNYDSGWAGTLGVPSLTCVGRPAIGNNAILALGNSRGVATAALLLVGFAKLNVPTSAGGSLLVAPTFYVPLGVSYPSSLYSGQIPSDPALLGFDLYLQALELDPGASNGLSFTAGLHLEIGAPYP